jgi:hypothetical protein
MKPVIKLFLSLAVFYNISCKNNIAPNQNSDLTATFILTDTAGHISSTFHSGEPFILSFMLINTKRDTIAYYTGNIHPAVVFDISDSDTTIIEPCGGSQLILRRYILSGDTLSGQWRVTNILASGSYKANIWVPNLDQVQGVAPVSAISLSIIK